MKLYMHPFSQHCRRVLMLCHELGLEVDCVTVALDRGEHQTEAFLRLSSGTGRIPVLEDGDFTLAESHSIMKYLSAGAGDRTHYPSDPKARARVDMWLDWNHTRLNPPVQTIAIQLFRMGENADKGLVAASHAEARAALVILDGALRSRGGAGGAPNLADFSIASTLGIYEMFSGDVSAHPAVATWFGEMKQRPSYQQTAPKMG